MTQKKDFTNKLIHELSPYLLQHANNPVDWLPWGEEAFKLAKELDKPIFLSIGYSTCHWCHVMAHESFEDPEIAELMNQYFVSVKVDREEKPEVDAIYMKVCNMLTGGGGWPLTIIMTPDKKPFFAGTYFPKENTMGRSGMRDVITKIGSAWPARKNEIIQSSEDIFRKLQYFSFFDSAEIPSKEYLNVCFDSLTRIYDKDNGGFGGSPKFPVPHQISFLFAYWKLTNNEQARDMALDSLEKMAQGGIYDHIGFGFHRYSTDKKWFIPHFEKMLYDQAQLLIAYAQAWQISKKPIFKNIALQIIQFVKDELTSPENAFYSAIDADSEGAEGKFYIWSALELKEALGDKYEIFADTFSVTDKGNISDNESDPLFGSNILHREKMLYEINEKYKILDDDLTALLEKSRSKLYQLRKLRIPPHKDDKVLTDWNSLMIAALSIAGRTFDDDTITQDAHNAADFIINKMTEDNYVLLHRYRNNIAGIPGSLNDYIYTSYAMLELYQTSFDPKYLFHSVNYLEKANNLFLDPDGAYFLSAENSKDLILRQKEIYDTAEPAANSLAFILLLKLWKLTANDEYKDIAEKLAGIYSESITQSTLSHTQFLIGLDFYYGSAKEVLIASPSIEDAQEFIKLIQTEFDNKITIIVKTPQNAHMISKLCSYTSHMNMIDDQPTAYLCSDFACKQPVTSIEDFKALLNS